MDDLDDISKLEQFVSESACMLLLLSKGYFISRNVVAAIFEPARPQCELTRHSSVRSACER